MQLKNGYKFLSKIKSYYVLVRKRALEHMELAQNNTNHNHHILKFS
jgi:hypothetical protein